MLAVHFATWIASLEHTTIARSVLLVSTSPIWVAVLQFLAGRGAPSRSTLAALALAIAGAAIVSGGGHGGEGALLGDLLAVAGGIAMAGYFLLSRESQTGTSFRTYLGIAYGIAGLLLWAAVLLTGTPATGYRLADLVGAGRHGRRLAAHRPQRLQLVAPAPEPAVRRRRHPSASRCSPHCSAGGFSARQWTGAPARAAS